MYISVMASPDAALVREVIATLARDPLWQDRQPLEATALAALTNQVPDSLLAWLAFDTRSPNRELALVEDGRLATRGLMELFEELVVAESAGEDWEDDTRSAMAELAATLPGDALLLRAPCGQDHFLYLGKRDDRGECCVLAMEHEQLWVAWPSFAAYVAELFDRIDRQTADFREACERMTALVLA